MFGNKPQVVYVERRDPRNSPCVIGCGMIVAALMALFVLAMCGGLALL
jgi:hypothetical protein